MTESVLEEDVKEKGVLMVKPHSYFSLFNAVEE